MATVLVVSSFVARGSVGLRAALPALERLGHEVIACPTVVLSNHRGHRRAEGAPVEVATFSSILQAVADNGWLANVDAVLTGYMPSAGHVEATGEIIDRLRTVRPDSSVVCDPVLGDLPGGLYVPQAVAEATRSGLLPRATHAKPNLFELAFLSGRPPGSIVTPADVVAAARMLPTPVVLASSVPVGSARLANVVVTPEAAALCSVERERDVPHGTGDLLAALFTGHVAGGRDALAATAAATSAVAAAIAASRARDELALFDRVPWHEAAPATMTQVGPD